MSYEVIWEPEALAQAERFAKDDPDGVRQVFTAVDRLADEPRPDGAFGSADMLRIHVGIYRVMRPEGPHQRHPPRARALTSPGMRQARLPVMPQVTWPRVFQGPTAPDVSSRLLRPARQRKAQRARPSCYSSSIVPGLALVQGWKK